MEKNLAVKCIVEGMELYFRAFALARNMALQTGDLEWVSPQPGGKGPSLVYRVSLDEKEAANRVDECIPRVKRGEIPALWVVSPTSTPAHVADLLLSKGFKDLSEPGKPEPGMALEMDTVSAWPGINPGVEVRKVESLPDFARWIDVVNEALHGWDMLDTEHYSPWIHHDGFSFFLACLDGAPVATVATIRDGDRASIEFMSTLKEYRNRGAAVTIGVKALDEMRKKGVKIVTLRSSPEAVPLYMKLGFRPYYEQMLLLYPRDSEE